MTSLLLALSFLTVIPVRGPAPRPGDLGRAALWFPLVGLGMGALLALSNDLLRRVFSLELSAALVVAEWAATTGGLHLDGLADCCDGMLASVPRERRLEIMRDPRLGSFGGIGLTLVLILKTLAIANLYSDPPPGLDASPIAFLSSSLALLLAPAVARWLILPVALAPRARPGGLGADFAAGLTPPIFVLGSILPLGLVVLGGVRGWVALVSAGLVTLGIVLFAKARLGGVTGDVLGLTVELAELSVLLVYSAGF